MSDHCRRCSPTSFLPAHMLRTRTTQTPDRRLCQSQCRTWRERQASKPDENRGRDKQDVSRHEEGGWKATDKASNSSRDVRSRHIKSSHVTTPLPATQKMRQKGQGQTTEHNSVSTTAYQQGYSPRTRSLCASTLRRTPGAVFTEDAGSGDGERSENPPSAACLGGWSCRC